MLRAILVFLTLLTSLSAVLIAGFGVATGDDAPGWLAMKLAACAATVACGALVLIALGLAIADRARAARTRSPLSLAARSSAVLLILLGAAGILHTLHLARVTGDLEAWVIVIQAAMIAQGLLGIACLASGEPGRRGSGAARVGGDVGGVAIVLCAASLLLPGCEFALPKDALGKAAYEGRTEDLLALLDGAGASAAWGGGRSDFGALVWAARGGQPATIRVLIVRGVDPNAPEGVNGWSPLLHAIHKDRRGAVEALLDGGADVNFRADRGVTPLMLAAGQGEEEIVSLLLARGADPRAAGDDGTTALSNALAAGNAPIMRMLLEKAPDLTLKKTFFNTAALWIARLRGRREIVALVEPRRP